MFFDRQNLYKVILELSGTWAPVPSPWSLFPSGTGLQFWSPEGYHLWYPGRGVWASTVFPQTRESPFLAVQKSIPKSITFVFGFREPKNPKSIPKSQKIHPQSHPEIKPQKTTKNTEQQTQTNLEN